MKKEIHLNIKDLMVWQKAIDFADAVLDISENLNTSKKHFRLIEQIEASVASISNNISEGKGRFSNKEFIQFLYFSGGSLYETVNLLNVFQRRNWITERALNNLEADRFEIVCMIKGLINSLSR